MQPIPTPVPPPGGGAGGGAGFSLGALTNAIGQAFQTVLSGWANTLPQQAATSTTSLVKQTVAWANVQGINFVFHTPPDMVRAAAGVVTPADLRSFTSDAATLAMVAAGISYVGQYWFGWPGVGESTSRVAVTVILVGAAYQLLDMSLAVLNAVLSTVSASLPSPNLSGIDPFVIAGGALIGFFLTVRLAVQMAKRIVWLATLYPIIPLFTVAFMHPKSAWLAMTMWRLWWGWLLGQLLMTVCVLAGVAILATVGGPGGFAMALATLLVAYDSVKILAPTDGGFSMSVGVGPARVAI